MDIPHDLRFNFETAYIVYERCYHNWDRLSDRARKRARRQIESTIRESGFNGKSSGLISVNAFQTVIKQMKGLPINKNERLALEHPITHKNIALHCLHVPVKLSFEQFFDVWFNNLITTQTTNEENQRLRKLQASFRFGVDCWQQMYARAGIVLIERPKLNTKAAKQLYGISE